MSRWAEISGIVVTVVVEQESKPEISDQWVECPDWVSPADTYENGVFTKFVPPPLPMIVTKLAMITRFTDDEYSGILAEAKVDVQVQGWLDRFYASNNINLEDSRTISGINLLVSKGLLTESRAQEILTTPVTPEEQ